MRTLLLYYSDCDCVRELCEASAKNDTVDVLELRERYDRSKLWSATVGAYKALAGQGARIEPLDIDFDQYDTVILATPVWGLNPVPAVNEFLHRYNLSGREVAGLLVHAGKSAGMAADVLRKRIRLAGGTCCGVVTVPLRELKAKRCDVCAYTKLKVAKAI